MFFLKVPDGQIYPNRASIHFAMIEDSAYRAEKIDCKAKIENLFCNLYVIYYYYYYLNKILFFFWQTVWDDVYGFNMSAIKPSAILEPLVDVVEANQMVISIDCACHLFLYLIQLCVLRTLCASCQILRKLFRLIWTKSKKKSWRGSLRLRLYYCYYFKHKKKLRLTLMFCFVFCVWFVFVFVLARRVAPRHSARTDGSLWHRLWSLPGMVSMFERQENEKKIRKEKKRNEENQKRKEKKRKTNLSYWITFVLFIVSLLHDVFRNRLFLRRRRSPNTRTGSRPCSISIHRFSSTPTIVSACACVARPMQRWNIIYIYILALAFQRLLRIVRNCRI